jgi:hypothetical protein
VRNEMLNAPIGFPSEKPTFFVSAHFSCRIGGQIG